jgi:predicted  nucleic acid-binding Zn-ribbon protein
MAKRATKSSLPNDSTIDEIDRRIAVARANLRQLIEQAAASSGAADEDLISSRIAEQETVLRHLTDQREKLARSGT